MRSYIVLILHSMAGITLQDYLEVQQKKYRSKSNAISCLEEALSEQLDIKYNKLIPHKYTPQVPFTMDPKASDKFLGQYQHFFFNQLEQIININEKSLHEQKIELQQIVNATDQELITFNVSNESLSFHYRKFLREIDIENHIPPLEL